MITIDNFEIIKQQVNATITLAPVTWQEINQEEIVLYLPVLAANYKAGFKTFGGKLNIIENGRLSDHEENHGIDLYAFVNLSYVDPDSFKSVTCKYQITPSSAQKVLECIKNNNFIINAVISKSYPKCKTEKDFDRGEIMTFCQTCQSNVADGDCMGKPIENGIVNTELDVDDYTYDLEKCLSQIIKNGTVDSEVNMEVLHAMETLGLFIHNQEDSRELVLTDFGKKVFSILITKD